MIWVRYLQNSLKTKEFLMPLRTDVCGWHFINVVHLLAVSVSYAK